MREILTFGRYYREKFNLRVKKVPISISGFTCPNIDGSVARGGCTYCLNDSFSPNLNKSSDKFYLNPNRENPFLDKHLSELKSQFRETSKIFREKYNIDKFIIYFQSFTNTYADIKTLKALYEMALSFDDVIGISVGTRGDSVNEEVLNLLASFENREIWIEFGVQSIYDKTAKITNRGESVEVIKDAVKLSKSKGLKVCGHLIFGLPEETPDMMLKSVEEVLKWGVDSLKIHPCYVVKNTALANDLNRGKFKPIEENIYIETLVKAIKLIPDNIIIQRITAGIDDDSLLAPLWCRDKNRNINRIKRVLKKNEILY